MNIIYVRLKHSNDDWCEKKVWFIRKVAITTGWSNQVRIKMHINLLPSAFSNLFPLLIMWHSPVTAPELLARRNAKFKIFLVGNFFGGYITLLIKLNSWLQITDARLVDWNYEYRAFCKRKSWINIQIQLGRFRKHYLSSPKMVVHL